MGQTKDIRVIEFYTDYINSLNLFQDSSDKKGLISFIEY